MSASRPLISFCMLNRNGGETLRDCLQSVAHLVDELIVVDTGSTDDSPAVARSFGARVLERAWKEDFAAARNEYLEVARGRWVLSLDADEVLSGCDRERLATLVERAPDTAFRFTIHNYFLLRDFEHSLAPGDFAGRFTAGLGITNSYTIRLFPRRREIRYCYPVHESLVPALQRAGCRVREIDLPIHHVGFVLGRQGAPAKFTRYLEMGRRKLRDHPEYPLAYLELGKLLLCSGEFEEAQRLFDHAAKMAPLLPNVIYYAGLARLRRGQLDDCRRLLDARAQTSPIDANLAYLRAMIDKRERRFVAAASAFRRVVTETPDHVPAYIHLAECCLHIGELREAESVLAICRRMAPWQPSVYLLEAELARTQNQEWRIGNILSEGLTATGNSEELVHYKRVCEAMNLVPA